MKESEKLTLEQVYEEQGWSFTAMAAGSINGKSDNIVDKGAGKLLPAGVQANEEAGPEEHSCSAGKPKAKQPVANSKVEPLLPMGVGRGKPQANQTKDNGAPPHMAPAGVDIAPR